MQEKFIRLINPNQDRNPQVLFTTGYASPVSNRPIVGRHTDLSKTI